MISSQYWAAIAPPLLSREETKMDMMRKSNFQLMVSCFNVW